MDHNTALFCSCRYWLTTISHLTHGFKYPHILSKVAWFMPWDGPNRKHHFQQFSFVSSCICCRRNVFVGCPLATAICSGPSVLVFQLPCHNVINITAFLNSSGEDMLHLVLLHSWTSSCVILNRTELFRNWICFHPQGKMLGFSVQFLLELITVAGNSKFCKW
jgi:hypothetical protein